MTVEKVVEEIAGSGESPRSPSGAAENVERIREILFGPKIRDYGQCPSRIEERLLRESAELNSELRRRLDSIEAYTRQEAGDLGERLAGQISSSESLQSRRFEELRNRSMGRFELASLLTEVALRVRGEFGSNGPGESDGGPKP